MHFALPTSRHLRRIAVRRLPPAINTTNLILAGLQAFPGAHKVIVRTHGQFVAASGTQRYSEKVDPARHAGNSPAQRHGDPLTALIFEFGLQAAPYLRAIAQQLSAIEKQVVGAMVPEYNDEGNSLGASYHILGRLDGEFQRRLILAGNFRGPRNQRKAHGQEENVKASIQILHNSFDGNRSANAPLLSDIQRSAHR